MLDEAANIAPIRDLATYASTGAGQGIAICSVWQDVAQIQAIYGRRAPTVINNHTARVFLPGSADLATLDATSRMIGEFERDRVSVSIGPDGARSTAVSTAETRLAPVEDLRQMPTGTAVVLYGREPALRLRTTGWLEDRRLRRLIEAPTDPRRRATPPGWSDDDPAGSSPPAATTEAGRRHRTPGAGRQQIRPPADGRHSRGGVARQLRPSTPRPHRGSGLWTDPGPSTARRPPACRGPGRRLH